MWRLLSRFSVSVLLFSCLAIFTVPAPVRADMVTWNLSLPLDDGGTVSGSFVFEPVGPPGEGLWSVPSWNITVTLGSESIPGQGVLLQPVQNPFTLAGTLESVYPIFQVSGGGEAGNRFLLTFLTDTVGAGGCPSYELNLLFQGADPLASPGVATIIGESGVYPPPGVGSYVSIETLSGTYETFYDDVAVSSVSSVPLPPSVFLLGTGLIPLAWVRRKKRLGK